MVSRNICQGGIFFQYLRGVSGQEMGEPGEVCRQEGSATMSNQEHQDLLSVFLALAQNLFPHEMFSQVHILLTKQPETIFQVFYLRYERPGFTILSLM